MSYKYYAALNAEQFIATLAHEPMELSWEKKEMQLLEWKKAAQLWIELLDGEYKDG